MNSKSKTHLFIILAFAFAVSSLLLARQTSAQSGGAAILKDAWQNTERAGSYDFTTKLTETTLPSTRITSAGRPARVQTLFVDGTANRRSGELALTLWDNPAGVFDPAQALEMRIEGTVAEARTANSDWQSIDDFSGSFAPSGDAAAFLVAARNVRSLGAESLDVPDAGGSTRSVSYERFEFTIDGELYAEHLRAITQAELQSRGELPRGVTLAANDVYKTLATSGEAWVDSNGLPLRMFVTMEHPQAQDGTRTLVEIETNFGEFARAEFIGSFFGSPQRWVQGQLAGINSNVVATIASDVVLLGLLVTMGMLVLLAGRFRPKIPQLAFALSMTFLMVFAPLLSTIAQARETTRFYERYPQPAATDAHGSANAAANDVTATLAEAPFDPTQSPLAAQDVALAIYDTTAHTNPALRASAVLTSGIDADNDQLDSITEMNWGTSDNDSDSDNDGLSDFDETQRCPHPSNTTQAEKDANAEHYRCSDPTIADTDGDGLTDSEEITYIGTNPNEIDTDGDLISDFTEVNGFLYGTPSARYYSDPRNPDSDRDELFDGIECPLMVDAEDRDAPFMASWTPSLTCTATQNGASDADILNRDNDLDGIPSWIDAAPNQVLGPFDDGTPLNLHLNGITQNEPVVATLQIRPTDASQLSYAQNILDWPSADYAGQVQRTLDTTIGQANPAQYPDPGDPAYNGDMRLIPMMEVRMPADSADLPRTTAQASIPLNNRGEIMGEMTLFSRRPLKMRVDTVGASGPAVVSFVRGTCASFVQVSSYDVVAGTTDDIVAFDKFNQLADGKHAIRFTNGGTSWCEPVDKIVEGETSRDLRFARTQPNEVSEIGRIEITDTGANQSRIDFTFDDAGEPHNVSIYEGRCSGLGSLTSYHPDVASGDSATLAADAVDVVDGNHVAIIQTAALHQITCQPLGNIVNGFTLTGNNPPQVQQQQEMIDTTELAAYQITVHEREDGTIAAFAPLLLTTDDKTGAPVAFSGTMFYRRSTSATLDHQVRVVWLVSLLNDFGKTQIIHQYANEAWTLTGLDVREERGIKTALIYEDPARDLAQQNDDTEGTNQHLEFEEDLWILGKGLEETFLAARTGGGNVRDITIEEIDNRWGAGSEPSDEKRWGIDGDALIVELNTFDHSAEVGTLGKTTIPNILDTQFMDGTANAVDVLGNSATTIVPTIMLALENTSRSLTLDSDDDVTATGTTVVFEMANRPIVTDAAVSWKPYRYQNDAWEMYPLDEYWARMEKLYPRLPDYAERIESGDEGRFAVSAEIALAQVAYTRLYVGLAQLVEIDGKPMQPFAPETSDADLDLIGSISSFATSQIGTRFVDSIAEDFQAYLDERAEIEGGEKSNALNGKKTEPSDLKQQLGRQIVDGEGKKLSEESVRFEDQSHGSWRRSFATNSSAAFRAGKIGASVVRVFVEPELDSSDGFTLENSIAIALAVVDTGDSVMEFWRVREAFKAFKQDNANATFKNFLKNVDTSGSAKLSGAGGLLLEASLSFGLFIVAVDQLNLEVGGPQFNALLADVIAGVIVSALMAALATTGIGTVIVAIITLIDTLIFIFCSGYPPAEENTAAQWTCKGISGLLTELVSFLIYDEEDIVNINDPNRLQFTRVNPFLTEAAKGFIPAETLQLKLDFTNTITRNQATSSLGQDYNHQYSEANAAESDFAYALKDVTTLPPPSVALGQTDWTVDGAELSKNYSLSKSFTLPAAGINQPIPAYFEESYVINYQQCGGLVVGVCVVKSRTDSSLMDLGLQYDIFPPTLNAFRTLLPYQNGYRLAWDTKFPQLVDADGDGLPATIDPRDDRFDTDFDGVPDAYEKKNGMSLILSDTDGDLLSDYDELIFGSDPLRADSDLDGLRDNEEYAGWQVTYNITGSVTHVQPSPTRFDADGDTIPDSREKTLGFSPWGENDSTVLVYKTRFREPTAPLLLMRMDELAGGKTIADSARDYSPYSGYCSEPTCPTAGHQGYIGNAALFDGTDDYYLIEDVREVSSLVNNFTVIAWVNPANTDGVQRIAAHSRHGRNDGFGLGLVNDGLRFTLYGSPDIHVDTTTITMFPNEWQHVAVSVEQISSQTTEFKFYVFGQLRETQTRTVAGASADLGEPFMIGGVYDSTSDPNNTIPAVTEPFEGRIDDVAVFGTVLGGAELFAITRGAFNLEDGTLRPGQAVEHETTLTNKLLSKPVAGVLDIDVEGVPPRQFQIGQASAGAVVPEEQVSTVNLVVNEFAPSGTYSVAQEMAAVVDRQTIPVSNFESADYVDSIMYDLDRLKFINNFQPDPNSPPLVDPLSTLSSAQYATRAQYDGGDITIATWINWKGFDVPLTNRQGIMGYRAGRNDLSFNPPNSAVAGAYPSLLVEDDGRIVFGFACPVSDSSTGWCEVESTGIHIQPNVDTHVAVTFNESTGIANLYINQELVEPLTFKDSSDNPHNALPSTHFEIGSTAELGAISYSASISADSCGDADSTIELLTTAYDEDGTSTETSEFWTVPAIGSTTVNGSAIYESQVDFDICANVFGYGSLGGRQCNSWAPLYERTFFTNHVDDVDSNGYGSCSVAFDTFYPSYPFTGEIWDLEVYSQVLDDDDIIDLVQSNTTFSRFMMNEVPSQDAFEDALQATRGVCSSAETCPTTGVRGKENLAAEFDGVDDHFTVANLAGLLDSYMDLPNSTEFFFGAWVYPTESETATIMGFERNGTVLHELRTIPHGAGQVKFEYRVNESGSINSGSTGYNLNEWHYVTVQIFKDGNGVFTGRLFYETGSTGLMLPGSDLSTDTTFAVGKMPSTNTPFQGRIDDITISKGGADLAELIRLAPVVTHDFDNSRSASDPLADRYVEGQINDALQFNAVGDAVDADSVTNYNLLSGLDFTVSAWVYGDDWTGNRPILIPTTDQGAFGVPVNSLGIRDGQPYLLLFDGTLNVFALAPDPLPPKIWSHVTYRRTDDVFDVLINGSVAVSNTVSLSGGTNVAMSIGGNDVNTFTGRLDEVNVYYNKALSDEELALIFNFQNTWIDERKSAEFTIDGTTAELDFPQSGDYIPNAPTILAIDAYDEHSSPEVTFFETYQDGLKVGPTVYALPCLDAEVNSAFCPSFTPPGEGRFDFTIFGVDAAANVGVYSRFVTGWHILVDGTAPAVTTTFAPTAPFRPTLVSGRDATWQIEMAGTVSDPPLDGDPGSSVQIVEVTVFDANGAAIDVPQRAIIDGNSWSIAYNFTAANGTATYTANVRVADNVGNQSELPIPAFMLDTTSPGISESNLGGLGRSGEPPYLNKNTTVSGTADENPDSAVAQDVVAGVSGVEVGLEPLLEHGSMQLATALPSSVVHYFPLDKSDAVAGSLDTSFADLAANGDATCSGDGCPISGISSPNGQALQFDGVDDALTIPHVALSELQNDFTVAAWIKPNALSGTRKIISTARVNSSNNGFGLGHTSARLTFTTFGVKGYVTSSSYLLPDVWQHVAVYLNSSNDAEFYVNGVLVETVTHGSPALPNADDVMMIGAMTSLNDPTPVQPFNGAIDSATVAQGDLTGSNWDTIFGMQPTLHMGFDERNIDPVTAVLGDDGGMGVSAEFSNTGSSGSSPLNSSTVGTVGSSALSLSDLGQSLEISAPAGVLPHPNDSYTFALWVRDLGDGILIYGNNAITFSNDELIHFFGATDYTATPNATTGWHHFAFTFDAATNTQAIYQDGQLLSSDFTSGSDLSGATTSLTLLAATDQVGGSAPFVIDDLRVYQRALNGLELFELAQTGWRSAQVSATRTDEADFSANLPDNIEGFFNVSIRGTDTLGNVDEEPGVAWSGLVDTWEPFLSVSRSDDGAGGFFYDLTVIDFAIDEGLIGLPDDCSTTTNNRVVNQSPWHLALGDQSGAALDLVRQLDLRCQTPSLLLSTDRFVVCDIASNCVAVDPDGTPVAVPTAVGLQQRGVVSAEILPLLSMLALLFAAATLSIRRRKRSVTV